MDSRQPQILATEGVDLTVGGSVDLSCCQRRMSLLCYCGGCGELPYDTTDNGSNKSGRGSTLRVLSTMRYCPNVSCSLDQLATVLDQKYREIIGTEVMVVESSTAGIGGGGAFDRM